MHSACCAVSFGGLRTGHGRTRKETMRLADFILANMEVILAEWEAFARGLLPGASMSIVELRDHAEKILLATARDMQMDQSLDQQASKSRGKGGAGGAKSDNLDDASNS